MPEVVISYDEIVSYIKKSESLNIDLENFNIRYFIYVFDIKPMVVQRLPGKRGPGVNLYPKSKIVEALDIVSDWNSKNA